MDEKKLTKAQLTRMHEVFFSSDVEFLMNELLEDITVEELAEMLKDDPDFIERV